MSMMADVVGVAQTASLAPPTLPRTGLFLIVIATALTRHDAPGRPAVSTLPGRSYLAELTSRLVCQRRAGRRPGEPDRQSGAGWDQAVWDGLACRLTVLTTAFLTAVVPRTGRAVSTRADDPHTASFMAALEHAVGLLVTATLGDSPAELAAAVAEAEHRWCQVRASPTFRLGGV